MQLPSGVYSRYVVVVAVLFILPLPPPLLFSPLDCVFIGCCKDVGVSADIKGIAKVIHSSHRKHPKMTVAFVAEQADGTHILGAPLCKTRWCSEEEIKSFSTFVLDTNDSKLVLGAYADLHPISILEGRDEGGEKKRKQSEGMVKPTLKQERPLEDQLLEQAGYNKYGKCVMLTLYI